MKKTTMALLVALLLAMTALPCPGQTKRALLIGISDYGNPRENPGRWTNISGANDVRLLQPLLKKQGFRVAALVDKQATHNVIVKAIEKLTAQCRKGDLVYLHFSTHGQPVEDTNGDEPDGWDEAVIPIDAQMRYAKGAYEGKNHLTDDELGALVGKLRSRLGAKGKLYVVVDACHSGTASRGDDGHVRGTNEGFTRSGKRYAPNRTRETNDYFKVVTRSGQSPVTFLEACRSYQQNKEVRDNATNTWYGSLSWHVAKVLQKTKIDKAGKWVSAVKAGMAADRNVRRQNMVVETSE